MTQPAVNLSAIPATLRARAQWGLWRVTRGTKVPYMATQASEAKSNDPATWTTYARAERAYKPGRDAGLAYFFSPEDGLTGIDLDKCRDPETGALSDAARALLDTLDSYAEVSPSGTGVKVWVKGKVARSFRATAPAAGIARIEVYSDRRFFAVTGQRLDGYPDEPQDRQEALDALAARYGRPERAQAPQEGQQPADRAPEWARRKLAAAVQMVALARDGEKHDVLLKAAKLAGGVAELSDAEIERALMAALGGRAEDEKGALQTIRDGIAYGRGEPLQPPATPGALVWRDGRAHCPDCGEEARQSKYEGLYCGNHKPALSWKGAEATPPAGLALVEPPPASTWLDKGVTLAELQRVTFAPLRWIVQDLLPEGVCLVAAKPKAKKSWLALGMAVAVAMDGKALNHLAVDPGRVLFLDLEGNQRRIQARARAMLGNQAVPWPDNLHVYTEWPKGEDGMIRLQQWMTLHPDTKLIVIDLLAEFRPPMDPKANAYDYDRGLLVELNRFAEHYHVAILIIHHTRKAKGEDVFDEVSGTLGINGAVATLWIISRSPEGHTILSMTGRDLQKDEPLALSWDNYLCNFTIEGSAAEVAVSAERRAILDLMSDESTAWTPRQIAAELGKSVGSVQQLLRDMIQDGTIDKAGYGKYARVPGKKTIALSHRGPVTPVAPAESVESAADPDPLAALDAAALTSIRLYLRNGDVAGARRVCERHGGDWAAVSAALRGAA